MFAISVTFYIFATYLSQTSIIPISINIKKFVL